MEWIFVASLGGFLGVGFWLMCRLQGKRAYQSRKQVLTKLAEINAEINQNEGIVHGAQYTEGVQQGRCEVPVICGSSMVLTTSFPNGSTIELFDESGEFEALLNFLNDELYVAYSAGCSFGLSEELCDEAETLLAKLRVLSSSCRKTVSVKKATATSVQATIAQ